MSNNKGFTLIELLVVIAIITILASIVAPKVQGWIERGRMAKAVSEVRNADLALTKMLADSERKHFGQVLTFTIAENRRIGNMTWTSAMKMYEDIFYELLRRGKNADFSGIGSIDSDGNSVVTGVAFKDGMAKKLGASYMEMNMDPWGHAYQFYAGPFTKLKEPIETYENDFIPFRAYKEQEYFYTSDKRVEENLKLRGNPRYDNAPGFPAANDLPIYIFSWGGNEIPNQPVLADSEADLGNGGGDDINNWDNGSGWGEFY